MLFFSMLFSAPHVDFAANTAGFREEAVQIPDLT